MNTSFSKSFFLFLSLLYLIGCNDENKKEKQLEEDQQIIDLKYAQYFDYKEIKGVQKLIFKIPYQGAQKSFEHTIVHSKKKQHDNKVISVPVKKLIATSTTHIPMIELLNAETTLIGFSNTKYISSKKTRVRIDNKKIKEVGKEGTINTEIILDLQPELIVGFAVNAIPKEYTTIENAGIPVLLNADWLEETPLGRAEWIKLFGVLFDKTEKADSIFNRIEESYLTAKKIAKSIQKQPTVLSGAIMSKGIWNLPAGESFVASFLKDANLDYLWKDTKGKGSLSLSFESVFEKAQNADFWIAPGYFSSKEQMLKNNPHYATFKAFKNGNIYTPVTKKGATGGVLYYELATVRPDLVLKDLIKITHPNILPNYQLTFFEKMR